MNTQIIKKTLSNGLRVVILPRHTVPKVSLQLWYDVGSNDEKSGETGIAHCIEHMIFKGTTNLKEGDIDAVASTLAARANAFTSHNYTAYVFDLPSQYWPEILPIYADCMTNARFDQQMLNSELKAIMQEVKMYRDRYTTEADRMLFGSVMADTPYTHPILGHVEDITAFTSAKLHDFYRRYYVPSNAILVAVGDVDPEEFMAAAEVHFGGIHAPAVAERTIYNHHFSTDATHITLHREVQTPTYTYSWFLPSSGVVEDPFDFTVLESALAGNKSSRLYRDLVLDRAKAGDLGIYVDINREFTYLKIGVQPAEGVTYAEIKADIEQHLADIARDGFTHEEFARAYNQALAGAYAMQEDSFDQAYMLGMYTLLYDTPEYLYSMHSRTLEQCKEIAEDICRQYLCHLPLHGAQILPFKSEQQREYWQREKERIDEYEQELMHTLERTTPLEEPSYINTLNPQPLHDFTYPEYTEHALSNGLTVLTYTNPAVPLVEIVVDCARKAYYDSAYEQGYTLLAMDMLQYGTKKRTAQELAEYLDTYGMQLSTYPTQIRLSLLEKDIERGIALVAEILTEYEFRAADFERLQKKALNDLKMFWDNPANVTRQLAREHVYGSHPYAQNVLGTKDTIAAATVESIQAHAQKILTPHHAYVAVVGACQQNVVTRLVEQYLGSWHGMSVPEYEFPALDTPQAGMFTKKMVRDQVFLAYTGLSVSRHDERYDALLLFDHIFGGGALHSMSNRLFMVRQETGLFYSISGNLLYNAAQQPGMVMIMAITSADRIEHARQEIAHVIHAGTKGITQEEVDEARRAIASALTDHFACNRSIAEAFIFIKRYGFSKDYFSHRIGQLQKVTLDKIHQVVPSVLNAAALTEIQVGNIE